MPRPFHIHLVGPSDEDSTYIEPLCEGRVRAGREM